MINGFSLAPLSERPPPTCAGGWTASVLDQCICYPRFRETTLSHKIKRNGTVLASSASNIVSVECQNKTEITWGGEAEQLGRSHPTAADLQVRPFVSGGRAFIHIIDGRVGRIITVPFNLTQKDGTISSHNVTLEVIA